MRVSQFEGARALELFEVHQKQEQKRQEQEQEGSLLFTWRVCERASVTQDAGLDARMTICIDWAPAAICLRPPVASRLASLKADSEIRLRAQPSTALVWPALAGNPRAN